MVIDHERDKLINAIIFFANNTRYLGKVKLFKLLYFLDFEHFKITGRPVTGLEYFAWKMGPVPVELFNEVINPQPDMSEKIQFIVKETKQGDMLTVNPLQQFDAQHFTKREIKLLESLAKEYRDTASEKMIEATHLENQPWHKIYKEEGRKQENIPYELAIRKQEKEELLAVIEERNDFLNHFR